ncbi:MAG: TRAP transporter substrate-binding protein DctP [Hyphomicrobiaceae bacterium]|nr:TRAP transporter substrate-binding protein DctP [Hyphomicrobiaceae bacterium]
MGRSRWIIFAALWLAALGSGPSAARELRLSHQMPESDARHRAARVLAAELKKRAPDLAITIHPNATLIADPPQQYEAIIEGKVDMAVYPMGYASAKFPELSIITMPGIPSNAEAASLLKGSQFETKLQELCEEKGFRILTWWWLDGGMISRMRPITGPQSVKGLTARSGGGNDYHTVLVAAGASILPMPLTEVRPSLEGGKLAVVQNSFEAMVSFRLHEVAKFVTVGGSYGTLTIFTPIIMSEAVWQTLSQEERQALEDAASVSNIFFEANQREAQEAAVETFAKAGVKVEPLSFEDYAAWLQIAKQTAWKKYRSIGPRANDLFDELLKSFINSGKP